MAKFKPVKKFAYYLFGPHLEEGEQINVVAHRHPFVVVKNSWKIVLFGFTIPILLWYLIPEVWFVFVAWLFAGVIAVYKMIFVYYFDAVLITNKSLIDVKWDGPFQRTSVRLDYAMIEGITTSTHGFIKTIFNYGTVQVNRTGGSVGIELKDAINPSFVESTILKMQEKYLSDKNFKEVKTLKNILSSLVNKHMNEVEVDF